jgi:hypothetical protein
MPNETNIFPLRPQGAPPLRSLIPPEIAAQLAKLGLKPPDPNSVVNHPDVPLPDSVGADLPEDERAWFRAALHNEGGRGRRLVALLKARADKRERAAEERPRPLSADIPDIDFDDFTPEEIEAHDRKAAASFERIVEEQAAKRKAAEPRRKRQREGEPTEKADPLKDYPIIWDGDVVGETKVPELVRGMLPEIGLAFISGQWGLFKTFVAIDLAFSVMTQTPFAHHETMRQGGVLFIAAEGAKYVNLRLQGVKQGKGRASEDAEIPTAPFAWTKACPPLIEDNALDILLALARATAAKLKERFNLPLALIVFDTVTAAANFDNANDASESQRVMNKLTKLAETTSALVLAVDHFGKDVTTGTRNSSAKEGAGDAVLALFGDRTMGGVVSSTRMTVRKYRDGEVGEEIYFNKRLVELEGGGGSIIINWIKTQDQDDAPKARQGWPKTLHTLKAALGEVLGSQGFMASPFPEMAPVRVAKREAVRTEYMRRYAGEPTGAKQSFSAHCKAAVAEGHMGKRAIAMQDGEMADVFWAITPC